MPRIIVIILLSLFHANAINAREVSPLPEIMPADTLPHYLLREVTVKGKKSQRAERRRSRLEYNVRKAYPYACIAARKIEEINRKIALTSGRSEQKKIIRQEYRELMKTFKKPLMKLSITQGRLLVRLIYRETNNNAFSHIREYKGGFNAYFWQSLALLFGNNLKAGYEPNGRDAEIEKIVQKIKAEEK